MGESSRRLIILAALTAALFHTKSTGLRKPEIQQSYSHKSPVESQHVPSYDTPETTQKSLEERAKNGFEVFEIFEEIQQESLDSYISKMFDNEELLDDLTFEEMLYLQGSFINEILCKKANNYLECKNFSYSNSRRMIEYLENDAMYLEGDILDNWIYALQVARNINKYSSDVNADSFILDVLEMCSSREFISNLLKKKDSDSYESYASLVRTSLKFLKEEHDETTGIIDAIRSNICTIADENEKKAFDLYFESIYQPCN